MIKKIIKISFILFLAILLFIGIRFFPNKHEFVTNVDNWLDTYKESLDHDVDDDDDDDDDDVPSRVEIFNGLPAVRLDSDIMQLSGITLNTLEIIEHLHEAHATGQVIDFEPLLQKRTVYQEAEANKEVAKQRLNAAIKTYNRLRTLYKERSNVSLRQVDAANLDKMEYQSQLRAANKRISNIRLETIQHWGEALTNWALGNIKDEEQSRYFERLLENKDVLVLAALPFDVGLPAETSFIYINSHPERVTARKAYLISPATQTNNLSQGLTYYFRTHAENLRVGMRLNAWVVLSEEIEKGVNVPLTAIIWYGGQPWVYVQVAPDVYQRRPVSDYRETDFGWFIRDTFEQNDRVVTRGGQLLLSEELRWQIPEEDDD